MGLDITAFKNLEVDPNPVFDKDLELKDGTFEVDTEVSSSVRLYGEVYSEEINPGITGGLSSEQHYKYSDSVSYSMCSFGLYVVWLKLLEKSTQDTEMYKELINFNVLSGFIGYKTASKLSKDFKQGRQSFIEVISKENVFMQTIFLELFDNYANAFEFAAEKGAVSFSG